MASKAFIRAIECWVPGNDRTLLELGGGLYGSAKRFAAASRDLCFGRGEGLPGQAWEAGRPVILKAFEGSSFRRTAAARAEGLTCGIAVPIFAGDFLTSVLVIFCGDDDAHAGAIELWRNDPGDPAAPHDMRLVDGYYGNTGDVFELVSRSTSFRRGHGLPGMAWAQHAPVFLEDLGKGSGFLRADGAVKVGINRGFAMPCPSMADEHCVMTFLSALATPIAQRVEVWRPDARDDRLRRTSGYCEAEGTLAALTGDSIGRGEGPIGRAFLTGVPVFDEAGDAGAAAALAAIPVVHHGRLSAVLALHLLP